MKENATGLSLWDCFASLPDPRMKKKTKHNLMDMITITICAVISFCCGKGNFQYDVSFPHMFFSHRQSRVLACQHLSLRIH